LGLILSLRDSGGSGEKVFGCQEREEKRREKKIGFYLFILFLMRHGFF
jgi:hypothetical protein